MKTAKHILLPWAIKTLTGNVELIRIMNHLGHGISYSMLEEIDMALCLQILATEREQGVTLLTGTHFCVPTVLAVDNIDRLKETLSGEGISHCVNGIIVQPQTASAQPMKPMSELQNEKRRSITPDSLILPSYNAGDRIEPPVLVPLAVDSNQEANLDHYKNLVWTLVHQTDTTNQKVSSWTGFTIVTRNLHEVSSDTIDNLSTINAPATQVSTVY